METVVRESSDLRIRRDPLYQRKVTGPTPKVPSNWKIVWDLLSVRGCNWKKDFSLRRVEKAKAFLGGSSVSSFCFSDCSGDVESELEHPRSFKSLVRKTTGSGKPPTPTTATTFAVPTTVPVLTAPTTAPLPATPTTAPASARPTTAPSPTKLTTAPASARPTTMPSSEPHIASAGKTTSATKGSRLPSSTRTEVVAALPALSAPLPPDYDAKKAAKGKGHAGDDRKRSSDRDDVIDVNREPKRARARSASPPRRVSSSVFESKASTRSLFSTLFLALVNKVGHELEAEVEDLKRELEDEKRRTETARSTASGFLAECATAWASIDKKNADLDDKSREIVQLKAVAKKSVKALLTEAERSVPALAAAEEREQCSAAILAKRDGELTAVKVPTMVAQDRTLETYAASVGVAKPSGSLFGGAGSCKAAVVGVDGKFSLIGGVRAEVTNNKIDDAAEGAGTAEAPEEMRMDKESQGPRIDALTKDPRLDDVFGETEAEGVPVVQVAPPGVDEAVVL
ncbi:hypothetical protein AALP_AAs62920U000800 [Arabis alpina]|uniref:Uncharacterized protein n=1 Tax=Arabis alpina TaxID=50452 RepID=A0A087FYN0_ARAAL|nr:hypothetical protein AALP_AAs62920U000800 [Arabis alpina]